MLGSTLAHTQRLTCCLVRMRAVTAVVTAMGADFLARSHHQQFVGVSRQGWQRQHHHMAGTSSVTVCDVPVLVPVPVSVPIRKFAEELLAFTLRTFTLACATVGACPSQNKLCLVQFRRRLHRRQPYRSRCR